MGTYKQINNNELFKNNLGKTFSLCGWVHRRRDHGGVVFIDLRDRFGICQIVFRKETSAEAHKLGESLRNEDVLQISGKIVERGEENVNPNITGGDLEIEVAKATLLSKSVTPAFAIDSTEKVSEDIRLTYRFLDIRRENIKQNLLKRHAFLKALRNGLDSNHFVEVETPLLNKSTPEGARDFLVPSRLTQKSFYALPQSPQLFKQILMISGMERYYQIAKCFRDEDLRADRQPEFTQIDIEMSFVSQAEIMTLVETIMIEAFKKVFPNNFATPLSIEKMSYAHATETYGTDRPDTRFKMTLLNPQKHLANCGFKVFRDVLEKKEGAIRMLCVEGGGEKFSRKDIEDLTAYIGKFGGKGLAWMKVNSERILESNIVKFFSENEQKALLECAEAKPGDLLLFVADAKEVVFECLGHLRLEVAKRLNLIEKDKFSFVWVDAFPLFHYNKTISRLDCPHHPFTMPTPQDLHRLETDPLEITSQTYDFVLNGVELGGGGVRIHDPVLQRKIFKLLKMTDKEIDEKFGFFLKALSYGAPPHAGIAFGLDRIIMLMQKASSIRDVIAFPKTQSGQCLMSESPSAITDGQLLDLNLKFSE